MFRSKEAAGVDLSLSSPIKVFMNHTNHLAKMASENEPALSEGVVETGGQPWVLTLRILSSTFEAGPASKSQGAFCSLHFRSMWHTWHLHVGSRDQPQILMLARPWSTELRPQFVFSLELTVFQGLMMQFWLV